jgi:hypothetical protein
MVGPACKREAVTHVQDRLKTTDRLACASLGQPRSTQRYEGSRRNADAGLIKAMRRIAQKETLAGYRSVARYLNRKGWMVNINACTDSGNRRASECLRGSAGSADWATRPMEPSGRGPNVPTKYGVTILCGTKPSKISCHLFPRLGSYLRKRPRVTVPSSRGVFLNLLNRYLPRQLATLVLLDVPG